MSFSVNIKNNILKALIFPLLFFILTPSPSLAASVFFVSPNGNDSGPGTSLAPFRTFARAFKSIGPGDELQITGGTYTEKLDVTVSGTASAPITIKAVPGQKVLLDAGLKSDAPVQILENKSYINISGLEVVRSNFECVLLRGSHITISDFDVHDCLKFGYRVTGTSITIENSTCHDSVTENVGGNNTSGGWGSCLKTGPGSGNLTIRNNQIYHNWGEGLIVGQAAGAQIYNNNVYDNFSQNIYIGNAFDIDVYRNLTYSTNPKYFRSGTPANCISSSEELINSTWGAQLKNIRIFNNLAYGCKIGIGYTYKEVSNNGCSNCLIAHNTIVNSGGIKVIDGTKNSVTIVNNIVSGPITVPNGTTVSHNFTGNPGFSYTPGTSPESFRLTSSSPARNAGIPVSGITTDYWGVNRDRTPDLGAIEFSTSAIPAIGTGTKPGDANADSIIDGLDYVIWLNKYNQSATGAGNGDFNNNGKIDGQDYIIWLNNYNR